jgi:hypothetical protein
MSDFKVPSDLLNSEGKLVLWMLGSLEGGHQVGQDKRGTKWRLERFHDACVICDLKSKPSDEDSPEEYFVPDTDDDEYDYLVVCRNCAELRK